MVNDVTAVYWDGIISDRSAANMPRTSGVLRSVRQFRSNGVTASKTETSGSSAVVGATTAGMVLTTGSLGLASARSL